jgi:hypothetical protein
MRCEINNERNDDSLNAFDSIFFNDDGDSNVIESSDRQQLKQFEQRISTLQGIIIE